MSLVQGSRFIVRGMHRSRCKRVTVGYCSHSVTVESSLQYKYIRPLIVALL